MTATHAQIVSALYLAYCGRPAEPGGLAYWTQRLDEAGGNIDAIIDGFAYSAESATRFANLSTEQSIGLLYQELLNRTPEPVGTAYWQSAVNNEFLGVYLPSRIFYAAQGRDATTAQVRQSVADQFTALLPTDGSGYQGPAALDAARLVLQSGNASTSAADISALASAGITLAASATTNPGLITALTGANGRLTDLLGTAAGKADPLALVKLVNTIVSTAADSGAPVSTLLGNKTLTEVITTLRPGVTLTELEAAIQEGGFDNGVVVINPPVNPPVNPPAPPPDDGPAPGLTLTVAVDPATGKITFGGSATGDITFSVGADGLATFVRGGVAAGQKVALTSIQSLPAGTTVKLPATGADVTLANAKLLKDATWFDLDANPYRIQDSTAHILAELGSSSGGVAAGSLLGNATAISATDGPMAMTAAQFATSGFAAKLADGVVTLDLGDSGATGPQLAVIAAHSSKVAANGITGTLQLATLDGTTLDATHNSALLSKAADSATVSVDAAAMTAAELSTISSSIAKVDTLTHLALTSAQSAAEITALLGKTTSAKANTTDMDAAQLAAVFANAANLADNSITAATLSGAQLQAMDTAGTLGKLAAASVTLSGALSDTETALVIAQISKIATGGISAITLTEAQASAALLGQAALKDGAVTLGAVTDTSKEAVLGALDKIAPDGITAITLTQAQATPTLLAHVALKNGSVTVGAVTDTSKEAVLGALNKMADNGITVITLTEAQATPTLLAHAALKNGSVTLGAVTDDSKAAVLAALDKMAADGITTITLTTQQATPEVLAHPAFKSGSVTLSGTVDQAYLNSLGAAASKLATGSVQTITFSDDAALQEAALLIASDTVGANSIELTDGAITSAKATVLANLGKFKVDQVTSIMLTDAEATTDLLSNDVLKNGSVTIGAVTTSKEAVLVALDKIAAGGIGAITLTKAQATVELLSSAVLANGSVTISDAVDDDFFVSLVINSNLAKIAVGGITAITLGKQQATVELLGNAVLANGSVTISDAVDAAFLDTLTTNNTLAKIALGGIAAITLTEAQASADLLGSPILTAKSVTIGAVTDTSKAAVLNAIDKMANNGITAITLTKAEATTVVLGSAALKAGSVTINEMLTQAELFTLSAQWGKFAAGGITKFNAVDFVENNNSGSFQGGFLARAMFAEHSITLGGVRDNNSGNAMEAVVAQKIAPGGITSLNMNAQAAMLSLKGGQAGSVTMTGDKNAFKVGAITLVATSWTPAKGAYLGNKTTVLVADSAPYLSQLEMGEIEKLTTGSVVSYIDAFGTGKITSITLTSAQATGTILEKAAFKAGSVSLSDAVDGAYVSGLNPAQLNKIAVDGISAITLTKAQATAELLDIAALKAGSVTLGDAVDGAYLTGLSAAQLAKIAVNGISAITDSAANLQAYQQAHPGALQAFGGAAVTLTGASTAAGVADLQSLLQNSTWVYSLTDTLEHLQAVSADVVTGASSYTLTDTPATLVNLTPAQVALVQGASNAASYDVVAPTFASVTGNGTQVVLTFSEAIQKGSGDIVIKSAADNSTVATIAVSATQIAGKTLTLTLQDALDLGTAYYIEVAAGAVKDTVGNDFAGVSNTPITAASSFDLILISEGAGKASYRVEGDGTVTMTGYFDPGNGFSHYTFTPEHGAAQTLNFLGTLKLQVDAPLTLTGAATTLSGIPVTGAGTVVVLGSGGAQTLNIQTTGSNTINAGAGADVVTLGAGADKVVIGAGTGSVSDSRPAAYDTIHSFSFANDTIALPTTTIWAPGTSVPDGNGNFMNVSAGMASFHMTTSGLARKIAAALYGLGTNKAAVAFVEGGNTYLVYGDGVQGTQNSDIVVELIGVAATSLATVATDGALVLA